MLDLEHRTCKICGKDISDKRPQAIICESKECGKKWNEYIKSPDYHRYCEICGKNIDHLPKQKRLCEDPKCRKEKNRIIYNFLKVHEQICKKCGTKFIATAKQEFCEKCRHDQTDKEFEDFEQTIVCKYCGRPVKTVIIKKTSKSLKERPLGVCDECKKKNLEIVSNNMKEHNPMYNEEISLKSHETRKNRTRQRYKELGLEYKEPGVTENYQTLKDQYPEMNNKERQKLFMQIYNPMKNKDIAYKVGFTLKTGYIDGKYEKFFGGDNWNYKGNRNFNKVVRDHISEWIKKELKRSNYKCEICGVHSNKLHVHHQEPLREIIQKILEENNTTIEYLENNKDTDFYNEIINKIVEYHNTHDDIGIVVCPSCHDDLDQKYHKPKNIKIENYVKEENKNETDPLF
jgi:hypothetical protein